MSNNKSIPDVSSLLGNIAKKQKNGELGSSPLQTVKPIAKPVEETNSDIKEFKSKNSKTTKKIDNISSEADRRPQGGRPTVKREDVEYMKISPRIPKELRQEIRVTPRLQVQDCRDPKDDKFLSVALEAKAVMLVTGDKIDL